MQRRSFNWVLALVGIGLAGVVAVSAVTALAARTAATAFELTLEADLLPPDFQTSEGGGGTFRSRAPFCASGRFVEGNDSWNSWWSRFMCDDGTGSLTVAFEQDAMWRITDGSGSYADLRGRGSWRGEQLCGDNCDLGRPIPWRGTLVGVVDWGAEPDQPEDGDTVAPTNADTVAPSLAFTSASATKLRRPAGAYSIRVALSLRDDVEENTVAYRLRVTQTRVHRLIELASKEGTTASGSVSTTLRVVPGKRVRSVKLLLSGSDPNGNEVSIARSLKLPGS